MPFDREWDPELRQYVINRDLTGRPPPPQTGTTITNEGAVVARTENFYPHVPPATPVTVTLPGPNEPLVLKDGRIAPRWWRFFDELYRRTGGIVDNINKLPTVSLQAGSPDALVLTGYAATITVTLNVVEFPSTGSLGLTGQSVSIVNTS